MWADGNVRSAADKIGGLKESCTDERRRHLNYPKIPFRNIYLYVRLIHEQRKNDQRDYSSLGHGTRVLLADMKIPYETSLTLPG